MRLRPLRRVFLFSAVFYALVYVLAVGMVFQLPYQLPPSFPTPSVDVVSDGSFGQTPLVRIFLNSRWVVSVNPESLISLTVLSSLFGLNVAVAFYLRMYGSCKAVRELHLSWAAAVPGLFSFFSCCGSGFVSTALIALGAGLSVLQEFGKYFTFLSATVLSANLYTMYRKGDGAAKASSTIQPSKLSRGQR